MSIMFLTQDALHIYTQTYMRQGFLIRKICYLIIIRLEKMGALDVNKVVKEHQGWRLITCIWLHAGVVHILANMISLLLIGIRLEQEFGFGM